MKDTSVDWFRVLWDLIQRGQNLAAIERATGISSSTLRGYLEGSHPPHWRGEKLERLWVEHTGKSRSAVPRCDVVLAPRVVQPESAVRANGEAVRRLEDAWRAGA